MLNARFEKLKAASTLNGIDYVEADDKKVTVRFVRDLRLGDLKAADFTLTGGERIKDVGPWSVSHPAGTNDVVITVARRGDFSNYTLRLNPADSGLNAAFDPVFREAKFSFRAACDSDFDCQDDTVCAAPEPAEPPLDYLARDYQTFRRLMLDRMTNLVPDWKERSPADPGVALVEAMAYVADRLSYRQDVIATESYLGTARSRISVRRHARLVDYTMHDGRNARAFVRFNVSADITLNLPAVGSALFIRTDGLAKQVDHNKVSPDLPTFETMEKPTGLFVAHNRIVVHDWGLEEITLPKGTTKATLKGPLPNLQVGDWLMFVEARGPSSGDVEDADPAKRHVVRLTKVTPAVDPLATPTTVVEVEWNQEDALPFTLCLAHRVTSETGSRLIEGIGEAWGNLVLADHGRTFAPFAYEAGQTLRSDLLTAVTQTPPSPAAGASAYSCLQNTDKAVPRLDLKDGDGRSWHLQSDLIGSGPDQPDVVLEVDDRAIGHLRFGDGVNGLIPTSTFTINGRNGNGVAGNVAANAIYHLGWLDNRIVSVSNPMPAIGGEEPETAEHVRQTAPFAFRTNKRAVTEDDYAHYAGLYKGVQRAAARFRWTGSWRTVFILVDRLDGKDIDEPFAESLLDFLEPYRMAGHDIEIRGPRYVSIEVQVEVCTSPDRFNEDVEQEVRRALLPIFSADSLTFGQAVRLSPIIAAAQNVPGVTHVRVSKFQRQNQPSGQSLQDGFLTLDPLEVARLDDDLDFPERGKLTVNVEGGR
jgi:hypothetical protein